jgi:hypothetical protein
MPLTDTSCTLEAAMPIIPNLQTVPTSASAPLDAEHDLIAAIFRQALVDLRPSAEPSAHASAIRFWRGGGGDLAWFCEVLGVDMTQTQRCIAARYPDVFAPRQLELALEAF